MKRCTICQHSKPLREFGEDRRVKDGRKGCCRPCEAERIREWRTANYERYSAAMRKWRDANKERYLQANREWHRRNARAVSLASRKRRLQHRFGLTLAEYDTMLEAQGGGCAVCGGTTMMRGQQFLHVDHDHQTGDVRGLLCHRCNTALGLVNDDAERLEALKTYLLSKGTRDMVERCRRAGIPVTIHQSRNCSVKSIDMLA